MQKNTNLIKCPTKRYFLKNAEVSGRVFELKGKKKETRLLKKKKKQEKVKIRGRSFQEEKTSGFFKTLRIKGNIFKRESKT